MSADYLPALRFRFLTPVFDGVMRVTTRESVWKPALLEQAGVGPGMRVLDLGTGTGTLAILAKQGQPEAQVSGLDADPQILAIAARKAAEAGVELDLTEALSTSLPYDDGSFDRVLSTLFFHHLDPAAKRATLAEVVRVLGPAGELHVADWGEPADPLQRGLSWQVRLLDGVERTRESFAGELPRLIADAGLADVRERRRLRTMFATLRLLSARR